MLPRVSAEYRKTPANSLPAVHPQRYLVLGTAQLAVGAAAIFARFALSGAPPLAVAAARLSIAAAILLAIAAIKPLSPPARHVTLAAAGVALAAHFGTWIWSLQYTSVAASTLLVATTPVWTALYDQAVRRRPLSGRAWLAMAAGGAGVALVAAAHGARAPVPGHALLGDLLAVCGAIAIAAYFLLIRTVPASFGTRGIVTHTYAYAALVLIAASMAARQRPPALSDGVAWGGTAAMALISQLLGHTAMNAALRWFSANAVAFSTLVEPVVAAVLALMIFREPVSALTACGGVLVLAAVAVFLREDVRAQSA